MFTVTDAAQDQVAKFFEDKEAQPIRIYLAQGCSGPSLALGLDEVKDSDQSYEFNGVSYVIEKDLLEKVQPVSVDFNATFGFAVDSALPKPSAGGCSGCGSSSSCCS
ncbi:MAG TPA: IscA/HesB family protein [Desulfomicrobiaceae bacterium]|jgi:Fe-S cluster assembly iron-binding protein IscA|nr:IscA/HesB family protein [Desulfomicrobiaceae bacterium]